VLVHGEVLGEKINATPACQSTEAKLSNPFYCRPFWTCTVCMMQ
jgi:hypothetical protein